MMENEKYKKFEIKGTFTEKNTEKKFTKTVNALNENTAKHKLFADFGSKHRLKKRQIKIDAIKEEN